MEIENRIIDYKSNQVEIEKWALLKGEQKYLQFIEILEKKGIPCTWKNVDDLVRYDKRLLINLFKYMSAFEDVIRAVAWNKLNLEYKELEESLIWQTIDKLATVGSVDKGFINIEYIINNKTNINKLRRMISHNKIMILNEGKETDLKVLLLMFKEALPKAYQDGYVNDINACAKRLNLDEKVVIKI